MFDYSRNKKILTFQHILLAYDTCVFRLYNLKDEDEVLPIKYFLIFLDHHVYGKYLQR